MNIKDIDLNLLTVFHAIYEARSISAAAVQLDLSQPGMSHALKRLRNQLDDNLFIRKGNGVEPTVYAESIAEPIRNAITFLEMSLTPKEDFDPKHSTRHFRLLLADFVEPLVMPRLLKLTFENPNVTFELVSPQSITIEDAILAGNVDMVVHLQAAMMHEISAEPLFPVAPILAFRKGHPIQQEANPLAALPKYRTISPNLKKGAVKNLDKAQVSQAVSRDYMCLVHSIRSVPALLTDSDCISMLPKLYVTQIAPIYGLGYFQMPFDVLNQDITLSWHRKNDSDAGLAWLRQTITDRVAELEVDAKRLLSTGPAT
ncbi:LysR family transcriptional regulator [Sulfitobacter sp. M57]|uniref:LysR family transcriptional regulator n=1 Tax=unclassified Sulfitobacter TaxID=196795 RepID=UPI0023E09A6D|nr:MULTISPECIES: LysR family transcriptional regulator [unclassified Sulfitobacter]MDF3414655.1 LysR family transcriptional regulator [Sulfitobacter sp. KE5]MDF3422136.1 LysR family transcriptional regulator [Sulfitobacter sp. KE43]MDF3433201.1 LysR family transcriptional regulator [Sulfitobacter sp. KE42]MDF3458841.1 LysR family transcriptional regulator [Sulfitobacter sp. S74]MDF3462740.1 LysR family transcriptional regulator [Sulfitobacter sp. Ks18]